MASSRAPLGFLLAGTLTLGCATTVAPPSAPESRRPTAATVTPANPAGDALAPEDAALTRLLEAPRGKRTDRFRTLAFHLPDSEKWKRVRIFGNPARTTHRYGDDHFAVQVVEYAEAEDDAPQSCLEHFSSRVTTVADAFALELAPFERGLARHARGVESIDWKQREAGEARRAEERRRAREQRRKEQSAPPPKKVRILPTTPIVPRPAGLDALLERGHSELRAWWYAPEPRGLPAATPPAKKPSFARRAHAATEPELGWAEMPYLRTSGTFATLLNDDTYVGAAVAYRSWAGTCLIQGFAVRVGTDEALAKRVVDRWLTELAPLLSWSTRLRARPPIENR